MALLFVAGLMFGKKTVSLTSRTISVACGERASGVCSRLDPSGVVIVMNIPWNEVTDVVNGDIRDDVRISFTLKNEELLVAVRDNSRSDKSKDGLRFDVNVIAGNSTPNVDEFIKTGIMKVSVWHPEEYEEVKGRRPGYRVFDNKACAHLPAEELGRSSSCYLKNVVYVPERYAWAYVTCFRSYLVADRTVVNPFCSIRSRVRPEVYMDYRVSSAYVESGSWIDIDRRVRKYINGLENTLQEAKRRF